MNLVDMILFNAAHSPHKVAIAAHQVAVPYGELGHAILAAARKLKALGLQAGTVAGVHVVHPIDHLVLTCALYRVGVGSVPIESLGANADGLPALSMILTDRILPPALSQRFATTIVLFDPSWFKEQAEIGDERRGFSEVYPGTSAGGDWIARAFVDADDPRGRIVTLTAAQLVAQLSHYHMSAHPRWDRLITTFGLYSNPGYLLPLMALWLGRTVCFAAPDTVREFVMLHGHDYLVTPLRHAEAIVRQQDDSFRSMHNLRGAFVFGDAFDKAAVMRMQAALTSNLLCGLATPASGLVAFAPADRFKGESVCSGFLAPWAECGTDDTTGALRVRSKAPATASGGWDTLGFKGMLRDDGMVQSTR